VKHAITKDLVVKFLQRQATPLEHRQIDAWLRDGGAETFYRWVEEWERQHPQYLPDIERARHRLDEAIEAIEVSEASTQAEVQAELQADVFFRRAMLPAPHEHDRQRGRQHIRASSRTLSSFVWSSSSLLAAAVLCVVCLSIGLVVGLFSMDAVDALRFERTTTGNGELRSFTLADGSRVTLNANSELAVPRFGFSEHREVRLTGEAEFSVTHTSTNAPFVVATPSGMQVRVLGTEFVVFSRERGEKVALLKGAVQVKVRSRPSARTEASQQAPVNNVNNMSATTSRLRDTAATIMLAPGDVLTRTIQGTVQVSHDQTASTMTAWKVRRFHFNNTTMDEVAAQIREHFGLHVRIEGTRLNDRHVTGSFPADDADTLLKILSVALSCSVQRVENNVVLH
jgi:ferric-dicitrate binding protein FerR (iron transport regulator)